MGKSLFALFSDISDYRCLRRSNYELAFMLTTLVIAFLAGHTSTYQAVTWMHTPAALALFASFDISFSKGHVPSYDTYARMLRKLDHEELALEFTNWMNCILLPANIHMAIDGKGLVGATERIKGKKTPYVLNVVETTTGLTIASIPIQEKTNEIKAIPEILAWITICSNMISIDAIGTQAEIIQMILKEQGDFLLLVKRNNPEAYDSIIEYFESNRSDYEAAKRKNASKSQSDTPDSAMEDESSFKNFKFGEWHCEKNRERMEYRRCAVFDLDAECNNEDTILGVLGATSSLGKMDGCFKTVAMYEGVRIPLEQDEEGNDITPSLKEFLKNGSRKKPNPKTGDDETCDIYKIGIVSSRVLSPDEVIAIKRLHWSVLCEASSNANKLKMSLLCKTRRLKIA